MGSALAHLCVSACPCRCTRAQPWLLVVYNTLREHMLVERCELLSCLLLLYEVAGVKCASLRQSQLVEVLARSRSTDAAATSGAAAGGKAPDSSVVAEYLVGAPCLGAAYVLAVCGYWHSMRTLEAAFSCEW